MRRSIITILPFLLLMADPFPVQGASPAKVSLLCEVASLTPGKPVTLGLHFKLEKGWHIYWKNPGDAGQPPQVKWSLPKGFKAGEILWPVPKKLLVSGLMDYGYEGETLLLVPLQVPSHLKPGETLTLSAKLKWLVCKEVCLPGEADLTLALSVKDRRMGPAMRTRDLFQRTRGRLPLLPPEDWRLTAIRNPKDLKLTLEASGPFSNAFFLPSQPGFVENAGPQGFHPLENGFELSLQRDPAGAKGTHLEGVLVVTKGKEGPKSYAVSTKLYDLR